MNVERNDRLIREAVNVLMATSKVFLEGAKIGSVDLQINFSRGGITNFNKTEKETFTEK